MRKCIVAGCTRETSGYAHQCSTHKNHKRRHGHPQQEAIRVHQLKPYIARVQKRIAKNAGSPLWGMLEDRWAVLIAACKAELAKLIFTRHERAAAHELLTVAADVPVLKIVETVAALVYMREEDPWRFKSDDSFRVQVSRRVRGLTDLNAGTSYDHRIRKVRRVYRDIPLKAAISFGQAVIDTLGVACLTLVRLDAADKEKAAHDKAAFKDALGALQ